MRGRKIKKICLNCNSEFEALMIRVRTGGGIFCSKKCYQEHRSKNTNEEKRRLSNIYSQKKNKYGLSKEEYDNMFVSQSNRCAICDNPFDENKACVDHSHDSGLVRGLLCTNCNRGLGAFKDDITLIKNAIKYLSKFTNT